MPQINRQPGTKDQRTKNKVLRMLDEVYRNPAPGINCTACGQDLSLHSDADCLVVMTNALKHLLGRVRMLEAIELAAVEYVTAPAISSGGKYKELAAAVHDLLNGA